MSVDLSPPELGFRRPFSHEVTETLRLGNPHDAPVAFKVKTTAPKQYCVRPNSGLIQPNGTVDVQVLLQAMKEDPPIDAKCRDKFLVQSVVMNSNDVSNVAALWSEIEKTAKSSIQERKIRVNFLPADGGASSVNGTAAPARHEDDPPTYSSPSPQFGSPAAQSAPRSAVASTETPGTGTKSMDVTDGPSAMGTASSTIASAATAVSNAVPKSPEDIKQQLADAKAQILKLTNQLGDPQLRQRKVQEASEKMQTVVQQGGETGVPVQIVAGLCLLSFLLAYFFF